MDLEQVVTVIEIGVRHAGCNLSHDEIGEAIVGGGLVNYIGKAGEYIAAMVAGGPEKPVVGGGPKKKA
jgi:hypothetical protein